MKNWLSIFHLALPILGALVPGSAAWLPLIRVGVDEAAAIDGATGAEKRAHVINLVATGAAAASATGKVPIDPQVAAAIASSVIGVVDGIKAAHEAVPEGVILPTTTNASVSTSTQVASGASVTVTVIPNG